MKYVYELCKCLDITFNEACPKYFVGAGATVEPYGSFVSNLFTKWGDLDVSIEILNGTYISSPGRKHKQTLLADVIKALRRKG